MAKGYIPLGQLAADEGLSTEPGERGHGIQARKTRLSPYLTLLLVISITANLVAFFIWQGPSKRTSTPSAYGAYYLSTSAELDRSQLTDTPPS